MGTMGGKVVWETAEMHLPGGSQGVVGVQTEPKLGFELTPMGAKLILRFIPIGNN